MTPLQQQYQRIKKQFPDTIVFFRLGDFYETFDDDAEIVSSICNIVLTGREMGTGNRVPLAGIPHHAVDNYLAKLIQAGHKVAIVEQTGTPEKVAGVPGRVLETRKVARGASPQRGPMAEVRWAWITECPSVLHSDGSKRGMPVPFEAVQMTGGSFLNTVH